MSYKNVDEREFEKIKVLLEAGLNKSKVAKIANRSWKTVDWVNQSKDLKEYKEVVGAEWREANAKRKAKRQAKQQDKPIVRRDPPTNDERILNSLDELTQAIRGLAKSVEGETPLEKEAKVSRLFGRR